MSACSNHEEKVLHIREAASITPSLIPEQYHFLKGSVSLRKYRINLRHPAYASNDNLLFTLYAWDHIDGGIHHGLAHSACSIIADNRFDGYLSRTCDGENGERVDLGWDDVLPAGHEDYYFYVPYPPETDSSSSPSSSIPTAAESRPPYRWPVVPTFQDWSFPQILPDTWARCAHHQGASTSIAPQSNLTAAIRQRDATCRITAFESGTEVAHLIPEHESQWFLQNSMSRWNCDLTLDPENLLRDLGNAVLLRSDMHTAFDQRKFVFVPKDSEGFVLHMLEPTPDIGLLYHNTRLNIANCNLEFLFARFAWSIFPSLAGFLSRPAKTRLIVHLKENIGERVVEEVSNPIVLRRKATASRANSPTKRSRMASNLEDDENEPSRKRYCSREVNRCDQSSFDSSLPSLRDIPSPAHDRALSENDSWCNNSCGEENDDKGKSALSQIEQLRQDALKQQRPVGFKPGIPQYDKHRSAQEELELMGVEIFEDLDGNFDDNG